MEFSAEELAALYAFDNTVTDTHSTAVPPGMVQTGASAASSAKQDVRQEQWYGGGQGMTGGGQDMSRGYGGRPTAPMFTGHGPIRGAGAAAQSQMSDVSEHRGQSWGDRDYTISGGHASGPDSSSTSYGGLHGSSIMDAGWASAAGNQGGAAAAPASGQALPIRQPNVAPMDQRGDIWRAAAVRTP